jgi:hypothetical protein
MITLIRRLFPSVAQALYGEGYQAAIKDILVFKDKIYTEPVTLVGDYQTIQNCTFLGSTAGEGSYALKICGASDAGVTTNSPQISG